MPDPFIRPLVPFQAPLTLEQGLQRFSENPGVLCPPQFRLDVVPRLLRQFRKKPPPSRRRLAPAAPPLHPLDPVELLEGRGEAFVHSEGEVEGARRDTSRLDDRDGDGEMREERGHQIGGC